MKLFYIALISAVLALISSCTSTQGSLPRMDSMLAEATGQNGRACVRLSDIDGYGALDDNLVSIDGGRKYYLASLLPGCQSIETSMRALFSGGFGEICGGGMDKVMTRDDKCHIRRMFEFESREKAFDMYENLLSQRKKMREDGKKSES